MYNKAYSHANQKSGWRCTRPDAAHNGPCALVPTLFPDRKMGHRYMAPPDICDSPFAAENGSACLGTGIRFEVRTENGVELSDYNEVYCECPAGRKKKELERS